MTWGGVWRYEGATMSNYLYYQCFLMINFLTTKTKSFLNVFTLFSVTLFCVCSYHQCYHSSEQQQSYGTGLNRSNTWPNNGRHSLRFSFRSPSSSQHIRLLFFSRTAVLLRDTAARVRTDNPAVPDTPSVIRAPLSPINSINLLICRRQFNLCFLSAFSWKEHIKSLLTAAWGHSHERKDNRAQSLIDFTL